MHSPPFSAVSSGHVSACHPHHSPRTGCEMAPGLELCVCLSVYPSIHSFICLSVCLSTYLSVYHLSLYLPVCLSVYLSIYLSVCLSIHSSIYPSIPLIYLSIILPFIYPSVFLSRSIYCLCRFECIFQWHSVHSPCCTTITIVHLQSI